MPLHKAERLDVPLQLYSTTQGRAGLPGGQPGSTEKEGWPLGTQLFGREQLLCIQQFLVKGLFKPETELCTIEVPDSPLSAVDSSQVPRL